MSDEKNNLAWGVDFNAPAPQKRPSWGAPQSAGRPTPRGEGGAGTGDLEQIPAPTWTPIEVPDRSAPGTGADDVIDVPVFDVPVFDDPSSSAPVAFTPALPPVPAAAGGGALGDLFGDMPAGVNPSAAADHVSDSCAEPSAADDDPVPAARTSDAGPTFDTVTPGTVTPGTADAVERDGEAAADAGGATDAPGEEDSAGAASDDSGTAPDRPEPQTATGFHLPARLAGTAAVTAVATPHAGDLSSMFDEDPTAGPAALVAPAADRAAPAPAQEVAPSQYASRIARLAQTRAAATAQGATLPAVAGSGDTSRYLNAERYYDAVQTLLAMGAAASVEITTALKNMRLTRDKDLDAQQRRTYEELMLPLVQRSALHVENSSDYTHIFDMAYDELIGIGPLGPLWRDDDVTEIMVSGPDKVTVERSGVLTQTPIRFRDRKHLEVTARDLSQRVDDRAVSPSNPLVTAQLPGARVQFAMRPVAPTSGVIIVIRKFRPLFGMADLLRFGSLDEQMAAFLCDAVAARATILVSGGTGSGKTTMINALSSFIPDTERVVTIEDALELQLSNTHVESLLTKEAASADDQVRIGQAELLRATLRMRPDRIIVGEIRDGRGCSVMLQAANTGHDGTMTTVHANTPDGAIERMADLLREERPLPDSVAKNQVTSAINMVVQIIRKRGRRYVSAISIVSNERGTDGQLRQLTHPVFAGEFAAGQEAPTFTQVAPLGSDTELAQKMSDAGVDPSAWEKVS